MGILKRIDEQLNEAANPLMKMKATDAAGKILGLDVGKKGSLREILAKSGAIKSVGDSMKVLQQIAKIIIDEME